MTTRDTHKKEGSWSAFIFLTIIIILSVPCAAIGAGSASRGAGAIGMSSASQPRQPSRHVFHSHRFFRASEGVPEVIVEQFQSPPSVEPEKPAQRRVYIQPQWVDGGYGVEILEPGYWIDAKKEPRH